MAAHALLKRLRSERRWAIALVLAAAAAIVAVQLAFAPAAGVEDSAPAAEHGQGPH